MKFFRDTMEAAKTLPKVAWVAAAVVPFGLTAVGLWIAGKSFYKNMKERKNK